MENSLNITITMFAPQSRNSNLFKIICEKERILSKKTSWTVKVLEQAGIPLINIFTNKFPIEDGCPKGLACLMCKNNTIGCSVKGSIYRAYCVDCQMKIVGHSTSYVSGMNVPTYVGESSRPVRERAYEHLVSRTTWKENSMMLYHWMDCHGTDTMGPTFKFEVIGAYADPLRRQLTEAIMILDQGTLNSKCEFGLNELCRLESVSTGREQEEIVRAELAERHSDKLKLISMLCLMCARILTLNLM